MGDLGAGMFGGIMMLVMVIFYVGTIVGWVFFIVAAWRLMRAHERVAGILREIAQGLRSKQVD